MADRQETMALPADAPETAGGPAAPPARRRLGDLLRPDRRGSAAVQALPDRVREAIRRQEIGSEVLIGWVQLGIVVTWAVLYSLAPKAEGGTGWQPVPIALAGYFLFTLIRLSASYRGFTPTWFLNLSIVLDVAILMALIWSFHLQYGQPPSFYLKAPTLLYVFIFIGLRALRFDPRFVLTAGLVAAAGWLVLVGYAVATDMERDMVTRDYVEYLTGNKILLGAEFDKIISILMVTALLTFALARGRRLLLTAVAEGQAAADLKRFFAPQVARAITGAERALAAGEGEARDAAILMVDIRGFTRHAATVPPQAVMRLLAGYQARMVPVIRAEGGVVDKFLGDGIMASFNAADDRDAPAADALRAADAVLAAADAWNAERAAEGAPPLAVNAAVAAGRVIVGAVGDGDRLEYTVIGDPVNLAAKLEKHNKAESARAMTTAETFESARAQGYVPAGRIEIRRGRAIADTESPVDLVILG
ncbi:MAG: adenylate/guanylate cyclase domain-containing protein [Azospirillaceae bacterium]